MKRSPIRTLAAVACAVALALSAAACGSSAEKTLTAAQWKSKAEKICKATNEKLTTELGPKLQSAADEAAANKVLAAGADLYLDEVKQIKKLAEPKSLTKDVKDVLDAVTEAANKLKSDGVAVVQSGLNPFADAATKAKAMGLTECGAA